MGLKRSSRGSISLREEANKREGEGMSSVSKEGETNLPKNADSLITQLQTSARKHRQRQNKTQSHPQKWMYEKDTAKKVRFKNGVGGNRDRQSSLLKGQPAEHTEDSLTRGRVTHIQLQQGSAGWQEAHLDRQARDRVAGVVQS